MTPDINPYQTPVEVEETETKSNQNASFIDYFAFSMWPFILAINLIIPVMFGWELTRRQGRLGIGIAIGMILVLGWVGCIYRPFMIRYVIVGGFVTALSQFFPIIQLIAGMIALSCATALNLGLQSDYDFRFVEQVPSEPAGFIITTIVGVILVSFSAVLGYAISWMYAFEHSTH